MTYLYQKACKFKFETKGIDLRVIGDGQEMKDFVKQNIKDLPSSGGPRFVLPCQALKFKRNA